MNEQKQLERAIAALEAQRAQLGDAVVDAGLAPLRETLAALKRAEGGQQSLAGERKQVTVLFADISGFTPLSEGMDPEAIRDLINACFERLVPIVQKYEGTVDKFMGDSIMAIFGAPAAHENDPERALRAALEMKQALARFNAQQDLELGVHFGINTGLVIAGGLGTRERQEYSVMGDAVNLAARLEDLSEREEILVGPDTYRLTAPLFEFEALAPVRVKGKAEAVPVYRLLGPKAQPERVRGIEGLESPLVGREAECAALAEALACLQLGVGGIVTIVGEAGIGKSRLMAEVGAATGATHLESASHLASNLMWVEGRCLAYGSSMTYHLWLDVLRGLLGVSPEDPPDGVRETLGDRVRALCPERSGEVIPYLGTILSLPLPAEEEAALQDLEGETLKSRTFQAVAHLVACTARERPLVVVCEDLHWADPTSVELLEELLALTDRVPLLLVCAFRPEREHGSWRVREVAAREYPHRHTDLWLRHLSASESVILVSNLLGVEGLHAGLRAEILRHAEGNPFFVEEVIRSLIDSGAIAHEEAAGHWLVTRDVADIEIPDTLHGALVARIDRLQEGTKRVLQLAAVIGRVFPYRVLAAISEEERGLERHLLLLQREGLLRERARLPELEYIFKHHLVEEAAYNGLLKKERCVYHRRVAEALEASFPGRMEEQVGLLAHHWERAEVGDKAVAYLLRAGDRARLVYAHQEAIDHYERALVFLKEGWEHGQAARTLMKLGLTYHNAGDFPSAQRAYEEGFAQWQQVGAVQTTAPPPAPHALRVVWLDPPTADPGRAGDIFSYVVVDQLFSRLVEIGPEWSVVPELARSWEILEGGHRYIFHLRDDARWSDGNPVAASDFEYAWKRVLDPSTRAPLAVLLYDIAGARTYHRGETFDPGSVGVRALDEVTLAVELEVPISHFLQLLAHPVTCPVPRHVVEAYGEDWTRPDKIVTNGPFQLQAWEPGRAMILARYPAYHGRFEGNLQRVELPLRAALTAELGMYEADTLDALEITFFTPEELDRARQRHAGEYVSAPRPSTLYIAFDVTRPPFNDVRIRRALALATDRDRLANIVLKGAQSPATGGVVPPGMPGHSAGIGLPYDPEEARRLLAEAGYPDGDAFPEVQAELYRGLESQGDYLRTQWRETLGVDIAWEALDFAVHIGRMRVGQRHMYIIGWWAKYPDPDHYLRAGPFLKETGWQSKVYDRLVEEARTVADQEQRLKLYAKADRILVEEAAIIPLIHWRWHRLVKPWVKRFPSSGIYLPAWKHVVIEPH